MTLQSQRRQFPRLLLFEAFLTAVIFLTGVVPLMIFNWISVRVPMWFDRVWMVSFVALCLLWLTFLLHAAVDTVRFVRNYDTYEFGDSATRINIGFRLLETLGAIVALAIPLLLIDGRVEVLLFGAVVEVVLTLAVPLLASGLIVLLHLGWLGWTGGVFRQRCEVNKV